MRHQQHSTLVAAMGVTILHVTAAHLLLQSPVSRSVSRTVDYLAWNDPQVEFCPHCYNARGPKYVKERSIDLIDPDVLSQYGNGVEYPLYFGELADNGNYLETDEIAKRHGICGDPEQNAEEGSNAYSTPTVDWDVLESYESGQVLEMDVVMNAYHWGHCEFFICNTDELDDPDGLPTQECFNKHPLTRAPDDDDASPIDPNYPGRYYVDPECREGETEQGSNNVAEGYNIKMRYVLPDIDCEHCILQMVYRTGNTCKHIGYDEYNPSSWPSSCAPAKEDWVELYRYICGTNGQYPEEFWGCSDISISSDGSAPAPTPADAPEPVAEPTPSPVVAPTPAPSPDSVTTPAPVEPEPATPLQEDDDPSDDDDEEDDMVMYEYVGCFVDTKEDRVLGNMLSSEEMTPEFCYDHCSSLGAVFMSTQYSFECFCSSNEDLDYERHGRGVCDMPCIGDETGVEMCGGRHAFDLYTLLPPMVQAPSPAPSDCAEKFGQCGGQTWDGPTCCEEGYECVEGNNWYSQCRPSA